MTENETIKSSKTIGISLRNPVASFALQTMITPIADVTTVDYFSFYSRRFEMHLYPHDVIVTDLEDCYLDRLAFEETYVNQSGSELIAFIPLHIAISYFFRLQRANIPICLWRGGLAPVIQSAHLVFEGTDVAPESTLDLETLNYLRYGTKDASISDSLPSHFRSLAPRLKFDFKILAVELNQSASELHESIDSLYKSFGVQSNDDAVKAAELRGINQLQTQPDSIEKKILEDSAMTAIAKWLRKKTLHKQTLETKEIMYSQGDTINFCGSLCEF